MKPINIEKLLSHSIGISNSYYRPTDSELLEDYLKVVDLLIIDKQGKLQKELRKYELKNQEETYIIKGKLQEREEEINSLKQRFESDMKLFTADDLIKQGIHLKGFKRERPQRYYLTEMKARIIGDNKNNVQNSTTGIGLLEQQKIQSLQDGLRQVSQAMLHIHTL
jgi:hypothetical protein